VVGEQWTVTSGQWSVTVGEKDKERPQGAATIDQRLQWRAGLSSELRISNRKRETFPITSRVKILFRSGDTFRRMAHAIVQQSIMSIQAAILCNLIGEYFTKRIQALSALEMIHSTEGQYFSSYHSLSFVPPQDSS
jgi:hypothetical protein